MPTSSPLSRITLLLSALVAAVLATVTMAARADAATTAHFKGQQASNSIIGGYYPDASQWPWMAAILNTARGANDKDRQFCGGTLVAPRLVVTAAHCMASGSPDAAHTQVLLGKRQLSAPGGDHIAVSRIAVNPGYTPGTGGHIGTGPDVALLYLSAPAAETPAALIGQTPVYQGNQVTTMGWGRTMGGAQYDYSQQQSDSLKAADLAVWGDALCQQYVGRSYAAATQICAGDSSSTTTTCQGDSGSPMMIRDAAGTWRLLGITSYAAEGCPGSTHPAGFAWVGSSVIDAYIRQGIAESGRAPAPVTPPAPTAATLSASLPKLRVRRGRSLRITARSSMAGELAIAVARRGHSLGVWGSEVQPGRNGVLLATRTGHRKFKRGSYMLRLRVNAGARHTNVVTLRFRVV